MAPSLKFTQITASLANFTTGDVLIGVQDATSDRTFTLSQIASGILDTPTIVTATISSATINDSTINTAIINTSTINNSTLNTATINNSTLNTATISRSTLNTATINTATINNATINTATINTAALISPTISGGTLSGPTINNPVIGTATISTATISNGVINTATVNTGTLNNVTINTGTLNNVTLNTATFNTTTFNNVTINTSTINNATIATATINNSALNTATITNATIASSSLNLLGTIAASQLGSAVFTGIFTSKFNKYRITFENVCPVATALVTTSLNLQVATSGTSWISAGYLSNILGVSGGTTWTLGTTSLMYLSGNTATTSVGTSASYGVNGWVEIVNPANAVVRKSIMGELNYIAVTTTNVLVFPSGFWDGGANAITSLAIAFQTGNIVTGTFRIYGII